MFIDVYILLVLLTGVFFVGFGVFAYLRNPGEISTKIFALLSLSFAIWCFAWYLLLAVDTGPENALTLARLLVAGSTLIPIFFLHWVLLILGLQKKRILVLYFGYIVTALFLCFSFSDLYVSGLREYGFFQYWPVAGPMHLASLVVCYFFLIGYALLELVRGFVKRRGEDKHQVAFILVGSFLGFGGGMTNFPLMYGVDMFPFGIIGVLATPFFYSYAAMRYGLMNLKVVVAQFFSGAIILVFFISFLLSSSRSEQVYNLIFLILISVFSVIFASSVSKEVKAKTELEKLAKDLRIANERLNKISMLKTEFVSLATHQLRSPLTAIKGYVSMILEGSYGKIDDAMREPLERVFNSTTSLAHVVQDFLDVSRIEQGSMKYDMKAFSFRDLAEEVVKEQGPNIEKSKLEFEFDVQEDSIAQNGYITYGDRSKLKQVVMNLIDNSIKYTKAGFVKVHLGYGHDNIVLQVIDSGIGIDKKTLPVLFQKFERADGADDVNVQGTGLGLYIARQIIEMHKGNISATSDGIGKGSTFTVELKRKEF